MTPPEYRDQALHQAKVDALAATQAFLDALTRQVRLTVEMALDDLPTPPPTTQTPKTPKEPKPKPKPLAKPPSASSMRKTLLAALLEHDERDALYDQEGLGQPERNALYRLKHDHLATHVGGGLWRPTLKGLTRARAERGDT